MQYAVPQFTDVEDKLIGPLTLKQFLVLLAAGGLDLFFWSILKLSIFFFIFALPITIIGLGLAFGKLNGRSLFSYSGAIVSFFTRPQVRVFRREEPIVLMKIEAKKVETKKTDLTEESADSRLKKLAYLLDQKTREEEELIGKNKI